MEDAELDGRTLGECKRPGIPGLSFVLVTLVAGTGFEPVTSGL
jgi:hypothetical protein